MSNECKTHKRGKVLRKKCNGKDLDYIPSFENESNLEIFKDLEAKARQAINARKIFLVIGGFEVIRQNLTKRGWIEKMDSQCVLTEKMIGETVGCFEKYRTVLSYLVKNSQVYFIWAPKYFNDISMNVNHPLKNRINRQRVNDFTLKEGLHNLAENIQWFSNEESAELFVPRSFLLMNLYQRDFFLEEFRRTTICSFLFFLNDCEKFDCIFADDGIVPIELIYETIEKVERLIKVKQNVWNDTERSRESVLTQLCQIDLVMNQNRKIRYPEYAQSCLFSLDKLKTKVRIAVAEIHVHWPDSKYDSSKNLWILKPINKSRGYGIFLMKSIENIFNHVIRHQENKYIVQKYIEKPLLIYKTKFDIRVYFLTVVTRDQIQIWIYRNCYLKFASQEFSLENLHESVHLTNHAIQQFYANGIRSENLPRENMWALSEFLNYLKLQKKDNIWHSKVFPKIKKNILAVVLASLEDCELNENSFELNGADFLLGFDYEPILLEINANPDLTNTTSTTRSICPKVLEDLIKVVIDFKEDIDSETGDFELFHIMPISRSFSSHKIELGIDGKKILPPSKPQKVFFKIKNFSNLVVHGEKLSKKPSNFKVPMKMKMAFGPDEFTNHQENITKISSRKSLVQLKPLKLYKSPQKPRNIFKQIIVRPSYSNDIYLQKLPSVLKSNNHKFVNLCDLMRHLTLKK